MAVTEVVMPAMGADMTEGSIARWLKGEGDEVGRGDILAEVETDKAVVEMEAYGAGVLRKVIVGEGVTVPVGQLIAIIAGADEEIPDIAESGSAPPPAPPAPEPAPAPVATAAATASAATEPAAGGRIKASPIARKIAAEHGIDLSTVAPTGPGGRIVKADVDAAIASGGALPAPEAAPAPAAPPTPVAPAGADIPLSGMRKAIARTVVRSKADQPDFWVTVAVDMTEALNAREQLNATFAGEGVKISVNDMILKAVAMAIAKYPKWNTSFVDDRLIAHPDVNIGVAIALPDGLMVPAISRCQDKTLKEISVAARDLGNRAKEGKLTQEEMTGGTFSVSNLGMFGVDEFAAIIMPPQSGILAVGASTPTPVARDGELVIADIMKMTLSVDHRINDGAEAAVFINQIKTALENPLGLVL